MSEGGFLGFALVLASTAVIALVIGQTRIRHKLKLIVLAGLGLRIAGSLTYLYLVGGYYGGGDYSMYFSRGVELSASLVAEDGFLALRSIGEVTSGKWWGTEFVILVTGFIVALIGPTLPGTFIVFSLISYGGIVALGLAFHRAYPHVSLERYFVWIALFPSLWFWPAALGKDAIVLCGVGLAALGFVGKRGHPRWLLMALGVALIFAIRPQVAATLAFALMLGQWFGSGLRWTPSRMVQGALFLAIGVGVVSMSSGALGVELFSPDEVEGYLEGKADVLNRGGSAMGVERVPPWQAPFNVLFRPFVWEVRGVTMLLASLEVLVLWILAWRRRREIKAFVRAHRKTRLFWMGIVFTLVYATALGMSLTNIGIIARQRIHILPFIFMLFAGVGPRAQMRSERAPQISYPQRRPVAQPMP